MAQGFDSLRRLVFNLRVLSLALIVLVAGTMHAQVAGTANIQGTITDATGAVIANAAVTLTNEATQVALATKSDHSGVYVFPNISIGTYSLSVGAGGFQTYTNTGIVLEVGSNISINVKMSVGTANEKVEVKSDNALALQTEDVSFKQTIDQTAITEMPLNGRQMTALIFGSGGSAVAPGGDFTGSKYSYAAISVSIAGSNGNTTTWKLDGGDNNDWMANSNLPFPFPDAVTQFSVESTALGAQDGIHSGGLVNVVTRSGTNRYHGSGFEFMRNNYIDATNFFSTCTPVAPKTTCTAKDTLHQNIYGFTFGGPVRIPKLYNGKDRLFFFTGFQFEKSDSSAATSSAYVPTAANLAGDFSGTDPAPTASGGTGVSNLCGGVEQLFDPITGAILPGNKYASAPAFNAASLKLLSYLPKVSPLTDGSDLCGHVAYAIPQLTNYKQFVTRIDFTINPKNNLYGRYFLDGYQSPAPFSPTNILFTTQSGNVERVQTATIGENWTISSSTVNSVHATISRRVNNRGYNPSDINLSDLGITSANAFQLIKNGLQLTNTTSGKSHGFTIGGGTNSVSHFNDNAFTISDDVTLVRGRHQFVIGGEFVRNQLNISNAYESNGTETFNGIYSSNGPTGTGSGVGGSAQAAAGDANLDFLWGSMSAFQQSKQQQNALRAPIPSLYVQDTFHATPKLTVVAGVRWEPEFYPHDYFNRGTTFNMPAFLANQVSTVYPNAPAGALFFGDPGISNAFTKSSPWQFSPNLGVSFDPTGSGKTVLRAGFELAYDEVNFFTAQRNEQNPPYATASSPNTTGQLCFSNPWLVGGTSGYGCAQVGGTNVSPYPTPQLPTKATAIFPAQSQFIFLTPQFHPSSTSQWTASVQHDFPHGWQVQVDYIGNKTSHAPIGYPMSDAVFIPGNYTASGVGCGPIATTGPASIFALYKSSTYAAGQACSTTANYQARYYLTTQNPAQGNGFVGGGGGTTLVGDFGTANYNGLVSSVNHRLSSTFSLVANWTWSKCLNINDASGDYAATSVSNPLNIKQDYGPCGSDFRHIENLTVVAKSGFAFGNFIEKAVLNNWEFAPLVHVQSGGPFSVTEGKDEAYTNNGSDRANQVPGVPVYLNTAFRKDLGAINRGYLNPNAFALNSVIGTFGNTGRNAFRGIPSYQFDAQVSRIFPIHDSLALDLRLEAFNMLNHPNYSNPSASNPVAGSTTFGQISGSSAARIFQGAVKLSF